VAARGHLLMELLKSVLLEQLQEIENIDGKNVLHIVASKFTE
jgi:hypothetical protein